LLLTLFVLAGNGCRVVKETTDLPESAMAAMEGGKSKRLDVAAVQTQVLRFADSFGGQTATAVDQYANRINTPEGRTEALKWKVGLYSSSVAIATGPNPNANLLDFVALTTLMRDAVEQRAQQSIPPGAFDSWLGTSRVLETNAWNVAKSVFSTAQLLQFRAAIEQWRVDNPTVSASFFARPQESASAIREAGQKQSSPGSIFSLVGLDPMSGLDPAVQEVTRTRLFAERALFAAEVMPFLMRWQVEFMSDQILRQEQVSALFQSADRLSRAAETVGQTVSILPDRIDQERKAILDALQEQEGRLRDLSAQVSLTLGAGDKMSGSLNTTLITFDGLMKRFGVGEPSTAPPDTNSPPFNILDYARTAAQVATMAQQLDVLIKDASGTVETPALDKRIASLNGVVERARTAARSVLVDAFLLAAGLMVLGFVLGLVYRRMVGHRVTLKPTTIT
jgi:hypothetical protein